MISFLLSLLFFNAYAQTPIKVAVLDTGLDLSDDKFSSLLCETGHKDFTGYGLKDVLGHGTHVTGLIKRNAGNKTPYCLIILKWYAAENSPAENSKNSLSAMKEAERLNVDLVNYSGGGPLFAESEYEDIKNSKALYVVAAGNDGKEVKGNYYPASYDLPNMIVVGSLDKGGVNRYPSSNFGSIITAWEIGENVLSDVLGGRVGEMTGTSMSTAVHTGVLIRNIDDVLKTLNKTRHICVGALSDLRLCSRRP